jgi:hypothetical protein
MKSPSEPPAEPTLKHGRALALLQWALLSAGFLTAQPKLTLDRLALHQFEDGPVLASSYEFLPGETIWFSCRIAGYQSQKKGDDRDVKLSWQMRVLDPSGIAVEKPRAGRVEEKLVLEDKTWQPKFLASFEVPPFAPGGVYRIPVTVKDELAEAEISGQLEFQVRGPVIEPAEALVIRNFRFLQAEDDTTTFRPAVYHPGGMLWARFDIAGYKFGDNNHYSVDYGLAILGAAEAGAEPKQLFAQPEAAAESKESFYPQRVVPGALSLSLDPNVTPGSYTLVVTVHDKLGEQNTEFRESFQIAR